VYNGASSNTNAMTFGLFGGERMRITGGGPILINRTTYTNVNNKLEVMVNAILMIRSESVTRILGIPYMYP
jgi:phage gp45-like